MFRYTDILRGLVAQPIMWAAGYHLGFCKATVIRERNPDDYLKDFESEIPCYLYADKVIELVTSVVKAEQSVSENLLASYQQLVKHNIAPAGELKVLDAWLKDLGSRPAKLPE